MSGDTGRQSDKQGEHTFLFVHTHDHHDFVAPDANQLLDGPYPSPGQFRQQDHALDVVVFKLEKYTACRLVSTQS